MKLAVILGTALAAILPAVHTSPVARAPDAPTVTISSPQATIVGLGGDVEQFPGIPFAKPPTNRDRLKAPVPLTEPYGVYNATSNKQACPQFVFSTAETEGSLLTNVIADLINSPLLQQTLNFGEDCLYLNVHRPAGTQPDDKLPVLFWIFGGGFEVGWNYMYDGSSWVKDAVNQGQPLIFVSVAYRVGGFGFLPGAEVLADGSANLGLLDQRLGLQWVADNIAAFGGDPDKVTIWGESAGAISVFDHMVLYNGDNTYKGKPLFRGAIMNSGSVVPTDPVDSPRAQGIYDTVVQTAGCTTAADTLECLRGLDYETYLNAANSVPFILSYTSVALSYLPRPDGTVLTKSPDALLRANQYSKVPFIIGDQEDEGTLFSLFQSNLTTIDDLVQYFHQGLLHNSPIGTIQELVGFYNDTSTYGSPFRTGSLNNIYPQFKRLAAIAGDIVFTLSRRLVLEITADLNGDVASWSYLSSYDYGTPILGSFHGSDILQVFFGVLPNYASASFRSYYISFVDSLDPNAGTSISYPQWPTWKDSHQLLNSYPLFSQFISDDFRSDVSDFLVQNLPSMYY
ncbi:uncharacterized protein Z518_01143 [Rhinocladiella mackenziei CBS 650.93]|uniref:Carboxylic ester hydrolase n=1 Tax=Rhinocladiella mackenziei CBS 650.93 TaxID=1442369 RepID=A0A0D2G5G9_9EURO|nr:uncharacterized protein Z518_01143 [Rhinocladiella mackenziei CBS 650.93]KIX10062.1 hypothetical protein Z518_01143 [Rhinocladiella mackenziei CBS 650.93]